MYVIVILIISVACYWATVVQFFWGLAAVWGGAIAPFAPPPVDPPLWTTLIQISRAQRRMSQTQWYKID